VWLVYDPRGLPGVTTARPGVIRVLQLMRKTESEQNSSTDLRAQARHEPKQRAQWMDWGKILWRREDLEHTGLIHKSTTQK
jgi:hypothetical protein